MTNTQNTSGFHHEISRQLHEINELTRAAVRPDVAGFTRPLVETLDYVHAARYLLECLERDIVVEARAAGATWDRIGRALIVSKQAAQKRFGD